MTRSLRIALISNLDVPLGGQPAVTELARELSNLGHRPTLFTPDEGPKRKASDAERLGTLRHASAAWAQIAGLEDLDVVHVDLPEAIPFLELVRAPLVAPVHHDRDTTLLEHYAAYPEVAYVAASRRQAELAWEIPFRAVIHHGLDVERYQQGKGGVRFVCVGISRANGAHLAVQAARATRSSLVLCGRIEAEEEAFFAREIGPQLGPGIVLSIAPPSDHMRRVELLAKSRALLAPIQWEDPLGSTMIESMLVGTPVIAYACGAAPEIVEEGVTGFLVHDVEEMCRRMREVGKLDREACRARARSRWSSARMARKYAVLYQETLERWSQAPPAHLLSVRRPNEAARTRAR